TDPTTLDMRVVTRLLPDLLTMSVLPVAAGLLLFGLPIDWALRKGGYRRGVAYGAAGALGGSAIGFAPAFWIGGYFQHQLAGTFALIGMDYGLVTALIAWLVFRRG